MDRLIRLAPTYPGAEANRTRARRDIEALESEIDEVDKAVAAAPDNAMATRHLADLCRRAGRLEEAVKYLERASELNPEDPRTIASLAWLLATNPDGSIRDGKRAVTLAKRTVAMTEGKRPEPLDILAAAYAETGDLEAAATTAAKAVALAKKVAPDLVPAIQMRQDLLKKGQPIRAGSDR